MGWFGVGGHVLTGDDDRRLSLQLISHSTCFEMLFFCICSFLAFAGAGWAGFGWGCIFVLHCSFFCISEFSAFVTS